MIHYINAAQQNPGLRRLAPYKPALLKIGAVIKYYCHKVDICSTVGLVLLLIQELL